MSHTCFTCAVCHEAFDGPHHAFDRRVETLQVSEHAGEPLTSVHISQCDTLFMVCSEACWAAHEPVLREAMQLVQTYPHGGFVVSCCRCGAPVNRTLPHTCFAISVLEFTGAADGVLHCRCLSDTDYAVLCVDCNDPAPGDEAGARSETQREGVLA